MGGRSFGLVLVVAALIGLLAGCAAQIPTGLGGARFRSTDVTGAPTIRTDLAAAPVAVWFEENRGELDLIALGPVNTTTVPVAFDGSTIVPSTDGIRATAAGCAGPSPACAVDGWLSRFVSERLTYRVSGSVLRLTSGDESLLLRRR